MHIICCESGLLKMTDSECLVDRAFCIKSLFLFQKIRSPRTCPMASMLMHWKPFANNFLRISMPLAEHLDSCSKTRSGDCLKRQFLRINLFKVPFSPLIFHVLIFIEKYSVWIGPEPSFFLHWLGACRVLVFVDFLIFSPVFFLDLSACIGLGLGWFGCLFGYYLPIAFWLHSD